MKLYGWLLPIAILFAGPLGAQTAIENNEEKYEVVITERANKIVAALGINDTVKFLKVRELVANQYFDLRKIHESRDAEIKAVNTSAETDGKLQEEKVKIIVDNAKKYQDKLHVKYLSRLSELLTPAQVDKVKDGMTYDALPITYNNYLAMLPTLSQAQKSQIWSWLSEARELAMDEGSSKEKLAWFGKYKGKITNYLTTAGYDLKREEAIWLNGIKDEKLVSNIVQKLNVPDFAKAARLASIMQQQYNSLRAVHDGRNDRVKTSTLQAGTDKAAIDNKVTAIWAEYKVKIDSLHKDFLISLATETTPEQITIIKDEMTYHGLQKEYDKFLALLPGLTAEHKTKIMEYLLEARENAMDVLSTREQNQWFAKYRGRTNNYLSAQGYDLKKATEDLKTRVANSAR